MIPVALVAGVVKLAAAVLELVPEPDPELRKQRQLHRQELAAMRAQHRHERLMARIERRRG